MYIYDRSIKSRDYIVRSSSFLVQFVIFKNAFTFGHWCHYALTVTVSWCYGNGGSTCNLFMPKTSLSTNSNLMHIALWSEDDSMQLSNCGQWLLFLKETKWLSVLENHDNQSQWESHGISNPFLRSRHAVSYTGFSTARMPPLDEENTFLWIGPRYNVWPLFCLNNVNWKLSLDPLKLSSY